MSIETQWFIIGLITGVIGTAIVYTVGVFRYFDKLWRDS